MLHLTFTLLATLHFEGLHLQDKTAAQRRMAWVSANYILALLVK